mgnify:CR=1 FL=1
MIIVFYHIISSLFFQNKYLTALADRENVRQRLQKQVRHIHHILFIYSVWLFWILHSLPCRPSLKNSLSSCCSPSTPHHIQNYCKLPITRMSMYMYFISTFPPPTSICSSAILYIGIVGVVCSHKREDEPYKTIIGLAQTGMVGQVIILCLLRYNYRLIYKFSSYSEYFERTVLGFA